MSDLAFTGGGVWPTERLGDLCDVVIGRTPSRNRTEFWNGEHSWLSIADMNQGSLILTTKEKITDLGVATSGSRLISKGTVLLSFKLSIGKVAVAGIDTFTNEAIAALPILRPKKLFRGFLFWALRSIHLEQEVDVAAKGKTLNKAKLERLEIPLPPLEEQKRIAELLDKADTLRRQRQTSTQLADDLVQAIFIKMFVQSPAADNWQTRQIEWMAKERKGAIRTGPFGSQLLHSEFVDSGIAVLGIDNAVKNRFEWGRPRFISRTKYQDLERYKVFPGDLLITIMGTLGRCAIVPDDIPDAINTKHLCCITLDRKKCIPEFLHACLLHHPLVLRQLGVRTKGAVMPGLNMGIIKELELPLPPIELQERFKRIIAAGTTVRLDLEESWKVMDELFGALQQRAFTGELDLRRLILASSDDLLPAALPKKRTTKATTANAAAPILLAPKALEPTLKGLDGAVRKGEQIHWSADYFKYRVLGVQPMPFSFGELMQQADSIFEEPPYEEIKDMILDLLGKKGSAAILSQSFDLHIDEDTKEASGRKEIVFGPAA